MKPLFILFLSFLILHSSLGAQRPNILFIFADDLGWSDVGYNGSRYYETPRIDQLVKEGMTSSNAYVAAPNCAPSRAALMFGQYAPRTGCYTVGGEEGGGPENAALRTVTSAQSVKLIPPEKICLARPLSQAGLSTAIFGKWHLGEYRECCPPSAAFIHKSKRWVRLIKNHSSDLLPDAI
jgi:arylsulfatase A-like enzyme